MLLLKNIKLILTHEWTGFLGRGFDRWGAQDVGAGQEGWAAEGSVNFLIGVTGRQLARLFGSASSVLVVLVLVTGLDQFGSLVRDAHAQTSPLDCDNAAASSEQSAAQDPGDQIVYGDKLKITFFETLPLVLRSTGVTGTGVTGADALGSAEASFPRSDMSGQFVVDTSGDVMIARIGRVNVAGDSLNAVRCEVARRFASAIGRNATEVAVDFVERQPVYVLGAVKQPGSYVYAPGLVLEQVLAKAGGLDKATTDVSREIERIRQVDRIRELEEQVNRLAFTKARLIALRDGTSSIKLPDWVEPSLADERTKAATEAIVANETASFSSERELHEQQVLLVQREVEIAELELDTLQTRQQHFVKQLASRRSRAEQLDKVAERGHLSANRLDELKVEIDDLTAREIEHNVTVAQSRRRLVEAQLKLARLVDISKLEYDRQISELSMKMDDAKSKLGAMKSVADVLKENNQTDVTQRDKTNIQVLRRGRGNSFYEIRASRSMTILPGDIVRINSDDLGLVAHIDQHQGE